jgi:hypothetical protein
MSLDIWLTTPKCELCGHNEEVFSANITHNLGKMAGIAGIYECLWHPEIGNYTEAGELVQPLEEAINKMERFPQRYKKYDADNGWGTYKDFLPWLKKLLEACEEYPESKIGVGI